MNDSMIRFSSTVRLGAMLTWTALLGATALAQGAPPLSSMPMPPSASDPAPKETTKAKPASKPTAKKAKRSDASDGLESPAPKARRNSKAAAETYERPARYVPEEFDRGSSGGSRAQPFISDGGRAGMSTRF